MIQTIPIQIDQFLVMTKALLQQLKMCESLYPRGLISFQSQFLICVGTFLYHDFLLLCMQASSKAGAMDLVLNCFQLLSATLKYFFLNTFTHFQLIYKYPLLSLTCT